jgi:type II secretory ATPase GspE/PulE/Tfp pilus assembly ATPase PilB-like protein
MTHRTEPRGYPNGGGDVRTAGPAGRSEAPWLGDLLVLEGFITEAQLRDALRVQQGLPSRARLGQILVEQQAITPRQLTLFLDLYRRRSRLGEILLKMKIITQDQLQTALEYQRAGGIRLGEALLKLGYVTEATLRRALSTNLNIPFVELESVALDPSLAKLVNRSYARAKAVVPIARTDDTLTLAMEDPTDISVAEELGGSIGLAINVVATTRDDLERAFAQVYDGVAEDGTAGEMSEGQLEIITEAEAPRRPQALEEYAAQKAETLVRTLIQKAAERRASDIHLEALNGRARARYRVDGVLQGLGSPTLEEAVSRTYPQIVSRIKVLGRLDLAERRRPQSGSFRARLARDGQLKTFDFRVSTIPSYYGENVVLRVLDPRGAPKHVSALGFSPALTGRLGELLGKTNGILLITGPTGSGKTTTLYAALMTLYRPEIRILTAEDPIEYVYEHFSQSEVNDRIGNTFSNYLRAFLRHDPEIIMLGEIRDAETAEVAFRAAQTGHLLLSTLHTNDAVSAVTRLVDLKVDRSLITSSLLGVLAQRLVRQNCRTCTEEYEPADQVVREFFHGPPQGLRFYRGRGCSECGFTGYKGRLCVGELWIPNDIDILLINKAAPFDEIRASARFDTLTMAEDIADRLRAGDTTLEELVRTLPYSAIAEFRHAFKLDSPRSAR